MGLIVGLTGGIASGKSTAAKLFIADGYEHFDADAEIHEMYKQTATKAYFLHVHPWAIDGREINRAWIGYEIIDHPEILKALEEYFGKRLKERLEEWLEEKKGRRCLLDIPLLFEAGLEEYCDKVVTVHCSPETQRQRCISTRAMDENLFDRLVGNQWTREQRIEKSDHAVSTDQPKMDTEAEIARILETLRDE